MGEGGPVREVGTKGLGRRSVRDSPGEWGAGGVRYFTSYCVPKARIRDFDLPDPSLGSGLRHSEIRSMSWRGTEPKGQTFLPPYYLR